MAEWGLLQPTIRPNPYDLHHHHHHIEDHQSQHLDQEDFFGSIDFKKDYDHQAIAYCFPHLFDHATSSTMETVVKDESDHLYKPLNYPVPAAAAAADHMQNNIHHHYQEIQQDQEQVIKTFSGSAPTSSQLAPKPKKSRKNQQKRVVVQVTADGLSSDPWAWRKYGQKPIKGSIYPRSYYRCSSSKVCMARRQVEQSCTDSSIYILTYTADHNHPQPTRRNSLAGINRSRFKAAAKSPTNSDAAKTVTKTKGSPLHSPTTISAASSMEDEVIPQSNIKLETMFCNSFDNQGYKMMPEINDIEEDQYMVFSDDFFEGLEDLGGYKMETSSCYSSSKQFPNLFC